LQNINNLKKPLVSKSMNISAKSAGKPRRLWRVILLLGVTLLLRILEPDVLRWFNWFSLLGIVSIYLVQLKLHQTVTELYSQAGIQ
jgi:hypothetical protein